MQVINNINYHYFTTYWRGYFVSAFIVYAIIIRHFFLLEKRATFIRWHFVRRMFVRLNSWSLMLMLMLIILTFWTMMYCFSSCLDPGPFTLSGFVTSLFFEILNCKSRVTANWKVEIPRLWPKSFWFRQKIYECQNKSKFCTFSWTKIFDLSFVLHEEIRNLFKIACFLNAIVV